MGVEKYTIKEKSWLAKIAAWKLDAHSVAIVFGSTIHLHNSTREEFLNNERWLRHELCHIQQYRRYGFINFIMRYVWENMRKGYQQNKYEVEARQAEVE